MVIIEKRGVRTKVSRQSYERMFKNKGFRIVGEDTVKEKAKEKQPGPEKQETKTEETKTEETKTEETNETNVDEIPVSEMSKEQLAEFASKHNIDTSSARNVREARQIVQKWMRENTMKK